MDLFWMPVVEPYAISDRFSTEGKINMNYQILPFTYIQRNTGLQALLKSELVTAIPNLTGTPTVNNVFTYKASTSPYQAYQFRLPIQMGPTLAQFNNKFATGDIFKSASEICDLHMVPGTPPSTVPAGSYADAKIPTTLTATSTDAAINTAMTTFWTANALTGENLRERIYTTLYPRLTTKSNTYTVHFRVQALKKTNLSTLGTWTENQDIVTGEYRGSTTIERFIDANNTSIPDYAQNPSSIPTEKTLDTFYKWRVISNRQFAP
jgi:uncharacterized protein (TIGR02600 family)